MLGRRGLVRALGLAPLAGRRKRVGWESNNIFQVLIIQGSTGSGVFVYAPSPGFGNLVASIAPVSGKDIYGNAYLSGVVTYDQVAFIAFQSIGSATGFSSATGSGGPWSSQASISGDAIGDLSLAAAGTGSVKVITGKLLAQAGLTVTGGETTDTLTVTSTSTFNAKETITAGGLAVTGGETADTVAVSSGQAGGLVLGVTNTTSAPTAPNSSVISNAVGDNSFGIKVAGDANYRLRVNADGAHKWGPGTATQDSTLQRGGANLLQVLTADFDIATIGRGLQVAEGANARMGLATLTAGAVTVSNTTVTANTRIFLTEQSPGGTAGFVRVSGRVAGTSFSIASSSGTDTSTVAWLMVEPG